MRKATTEVNRVGLLARVVYIPHKSARSIAGNGGVSAGFLSETSMNKHKHVLMLWCMSAKVTVLEISLFLSIWELIKKEHISVRIQKSCVGHLLKEAIGYITSRYDQ